MNENDKIKILVVDDESIVLDSCQMVLEAEGFHVSLVGSVKAAIEEMERGLHRLILVDIKMPERDGIHLMKIAKEEWPDIPVIAMSGYHTREAIEEAIKAGASTFISKPFTPDELACTVRRVILKEEPHD